LVGIEDTSGVEILSLVHALSHAYELIENQQSDSLDLSGPRWGLLLLLMAHEKLGNQKGMTPTAFSRFQGVSRNTISSLLRGLEEQGYIQRALDPEDYRVFRIELTDSGREVIQSLAPKRVAHINQLASGLSAEEREQLITLLEKLHRSILENSNPSRTPCPTSP